MYLEVVLMAIPEQPKIVVERTEYAAVIKHEELPDALFLGR